MERESESSPLLPQDGENIPDNLKINWNKVAIYIFLLGFVIVVGLTFNSQNVCGGSVATTTSGILTSD